MEAQQAVFGVGAQSVARLRGLFDRTPGLERVWIYGSRARGSHRPESDIDLALDMPGADMFMAGLRSSVEDLGLLYRVDLTHWQTIASDPLRLEIERDRKLFWQPRRHVAAAQAFAGIQLKPFQSGVLERLDVYLTELSKQRAQTFKAADALRVAEVDLPPEVMDFPRKAWQTLKAQGALPSHYAERPHSSRFDGADEAIPNVCLKVPTGGGKTLLAAASVAKVFSSYLRRHTGLVLWIVPNEAIYRQTLNTLKNRDHPYHQMLNVAGAGRVKILEKNSPLSRIDTDSHLCVMLLMLASASRQSKETLRFFRDRGNVLGFLPREDDIEGHWKLLGAVPNLDAYAPWGASAAEARATMGSIVKSSLGNVMRLLRPMVVVDEGHHAYTETALSTIDGFNPSFMLELSATPRVAASVPARSALGRGAESGGGSNILVDVRGADLDEAEMIKLPIHVDMRGWTDWQSCLASALTKLNELQSEAQTLLFETSRYIRPILLVQVERTGKDLRDAGFIHAEDAKAHLMQLGLSEAQIAIKTSEKNDLQAPENLDLLSPQCEVRAIITKQALQEGWDCPFAYVLCALAAGRNLRAMTQLMGRILRQPHVAKTGRAELDACHALCHDAKTGEVVKAVKQSLESEGMGDLDMVFHGPDSDTVARKQVFKRREPFGSLRIFLPRVTWVELDAKGRKRRRELAYDSDVLALVDWAGLDASNLAQDWAPAQLSAMGQQLRIGLDVMAHPEAVFACSFGAGAQDLDRTALVRGLQDIVPNPWWLWQWVEAVLARLLARGFARNTLAASGALLLERLRVDLEAERDRLALAVFQTCVTDGRIEFRLRADQTDFEIPAEFALGLSGKPQPLVRDDAKLVEKSLFEPAFTALADSGFERDVACYLDSQAALQWWHRNVAKSQYGLQGWKRHKVYPDFVFARIAGDGATKLVVLETKGLHLAGSTDTAYKQALLQRLTQAFADESLGRAGELELVGARQSLVCDLVFDEAWRGVLQARYFAAAGV